MSKHTYAVPPGGLPPQTTLTAGRAIFTEAYVVIPGGVMRDIVTSNLPHWTDTRLWVLARPLSGFAETFSQYIMEVAPGGGSDAPEPESGAEGVLFVVDGELTLTLDGATHVMQLGGYAYLPPASNWTVRNKGATPVRFHWVRKMYEAVPGVEAPEAFVTNENAIVPAPMPDTDGRWATTRFISSDDVRHDMCVNVVTFEPGAAIPFMETHVMEHGLYVLEGKAVYRLNSDWV